MRPSRGGRAHQGRLWLNYDRFVGLKNKYNPTNLFRHNQNVRLPV